MTMENDTEAQPINWQTLFTGFQGRIRRQHFWIGIIILIAVGLVVGLALPDMVGAAVSVLMIWPYAALFLKRGHDFGKPDSFTYIPVGIGAVSTLLSVAGSLMLGAGGRAAMESGDPSAIMSAGPGFMLAAISGLLSLVTLGFLIWYGVAEGQRGTNAWGPNPKGEN